jgi:SAM-dependent methyltransferase
MTAALAAHARVASALHPIEVSCSRRNRSEDVSFRNVVLAFICAASLAAITSTTAAETAQPQYKPTPGQKGKDVVWIPSPELMVEKMLDMAHVTAQDFVIDLGSGDGRNVIAAARRGARALGVEYNPDLVALARRNAAQAGVADKAAFVHGDMYEANISQASALILFLIPMNLTKLTPKFVALKPGTRIVSNTYEIGGGWEPDATDRLQPCLTWCVAYLYIVPANVQGTWRLPDGELTLEQSYQKVSGTRELDGIYLPVENGVLRGNEIRFTVNAVEYTGRVNGDSMEGVANGRVPFTWTAKRVTE